MATLSAHLENEKEPIPAGQRIRGNVELSVRSAISGRAIQTVLIGKEYSAVEHRRRGKKTYTDYRTKTFLRIPIVFYDKLIINNGKINPGNYHMPFEVELPNNLPSSMENVGNGCCEIKYYIATRIVGPGIVHDYASKADFCVSATPQLADKIPFKSEPVTERVGVSRYFKRRHHATMAASLEDTVLSKSESVKVCIAARNNSKARTRRVHVELQEHIHWQGKSHSTSTVKTLAVMEFSLLPGLKQKTANKSLEANQTDIRLDTQQGYYSGVVTVPETANETFKGQLIECRHILRVYLDARWGVTSPVVEIPVQIRHRAKNTISRSISPPEQVKPELATVASAVFVPDLAFMLVCCTLGVLACITCCQ